MHRETTLSIIIIVVVVHVVADVIVHVSVAALGSIVESAVLLL